MELAFQRDIYNWSSDIINDLHDIYKQKDGDLNYDKFLLEMFDLLFVFSSLVLVTDKLFFLIFFFQFFHQFSSVYLIIN